MSGLLREGVDPIITGRDIAPGGVSSPELEARAEITNLLSAYAQAELAVASHTAHLSAEARWVANGFHGNVHGMRDRSKRLLRENKERLAALADKLSELGVSL
jgi:hypothetical protein